MLEHVLHDEVAEGVAAKLWSTGKHLPGAGGGHAIQPRNATQPGASSTSGAVCSVGQCSRRRSRTRQPVSTPSGRLSRHLVVSEVLAA